MDFKLEIAEKISVLVDLDVNTIYKLIEIPPETNLGDYAFPCFQLAKIARKAPNAIATELALKIDKGNIIELIKNVGGYLNFFLIKNEYIKTILTDVLNSNGRYGSSDIGNNQTVLVEFSSPNIAKPFHIGHLCTTVIGNSIEKIYKYLGYKTVRINYLGDWGTQFGKLISAYKYWGDEEAIQKEPIKELLRIYVKFHEEAAKNPELEDEARNNFRKLENNDPETVQFWKKFRDLSLLEFKRVYDMLQIDFDSYAGESFYSDKMDEIVEMLDEKGLLKESENAKVVYLEQFGLPPCLIIKSDGATIYATRDITAAIHRKRTYNFDKSIYVVGNPQTLHFKQVFSVLSLAGYGWYKDCIHVGFGHVNFADKKMSTRTGDIIFLEDVFNESIKKTMQIIDQNNSALEDKEEVAKTVGIGAIIYAFLKNGRDRESTISWDDMLDFDGESAPYVQYTYARSRSILRKAGEIPENIDLSVLKADEEFELVKLIEQFKNAILDAATKYEPSLVTRQVTIIARSFNKFYNTCPILSADDSTKYARIKLTEATCSVIKSGLQLLGINVPERM